MGTSPRQGTIGEADRSGLLGTVVRRAKTVMVDVMVGVGLVAPFASRLVEGKVASVREVSPSASSRWVRREVVSAWVMVLVLCCILDCGVHFSWMILWVSRHVSECWMWNPVIWARAWGFAMA